MWPYVQSFTLFYGSLFFEVTFLLIKNLSWLLSSPHLINDFNILALEQFKNRKQNEFLTPFLYCGSEGADKPKQLINSFP